MKSRQTILSLPFALPAGSKAAQISVLPEFDSAQPFGRESWHQLDDFRPNVLIGHAFDLVRLAASIESGARKVRTVDRAIFVLTDCGCVPAGEHLRSQLWRVFGVPVFELIIAPGCVVLAAECERQSGWHLQPGIAAYQKNGEIVYDLRRLKGAHTRFRGTLDLQPCECGRSAPRLQHLAPYRVAAKEPLLERRAS